MKEYIVGERIYKGDKLLETNFLLLSFNSLSEAMLATTPFEHWIIYQKNLKYYIWHTPSLIP